MSEENIGTTPRASNLKKKLLSSTSKQQDKDDIGSNSGTQRISNIVAKSKDPLSLSSSLKKRPIETTSSFTSSVSGITTSSSSSDDLIKKSRRKSFGEAKAEKEKLTTSKLKPKSTSSSSSSSSSSTTTPSSSLLSSITYTEPLKDHSTTTTSTTSNLPSTPTPNNVVKTLKRKSIESGNIFQFDQQLDSIPTTTTTTTTTSTSKDSKDSTTSSKKKLKKSISADIDQDEEEKPKKKSSKSSSSSSSSSTVEKKKKSSSVDIDQDEEEKPLKKKSSKSSSSSKKSDDINFELDEQDLKAIEQEHKHRLQHLDDDDDDFEQERKKKKKKSTSKKVAVQEQEEEVDDQMNVNNINNFNAPGSSNPIIPTFDGSSSVIGTTSNVETKSSKAYPKTPLPNKFKKPISSFDQSFNSEDADDSEINGNFMNNNQNRNMYFTPSTTMPIPPSTPASVISYHNYPSSPSPFNEQDQGGRGFEYSDSPISIPNISYITPSERDISFDTDHAEIEDEIFLQDEEDGDDQFAFENQQQRKQQQQQAAIRERKIQELRKQEIISQSKQPQQPESKIRYVLVIIAFAVWISLLIIMGQFFYHFNDTKYCDTGSIPKKINDTTFSCVPCPDKGVCMNGIFETCMDGYVPRNEECILNPGKVEALVQIINQMDQILRDKKGLFECGSKDSLYMTNDELKKEIAKRNWFSKNQAIESFDTIIDFIELRRKDPEEIGLDHKLLNSIGFTFEDNQFKYYSHDTGIRPLWCQTIFFFKNLIKNNLHYIGFVLIGYLAFKFIQIRNKKKQEELLMIEQNCKKAYSILKQRRQSYEVPWISEIILKDEIMGTTSTKDKRLNRIWEKTLEKISSNVRVLCTVKLIHGDSQKTLEWTDTNETPRRNSLNTTQYDELEPINNNDNDENTNDNNSQFIDNSWN